MTEDQWTPEEPRDNEVAVSWKQSDDGVYVEVAVVKEGDHFVVTSLAEHRSSGPSTTRSEPFDTVEEATKEAAKMRSYWDSRL